MSKQREAKKSQGYNPKPTHPMCSNCAHYSSDIVEERAAYGSGVYRRETNIRCGLGGFAVKKMGNCAEHKFSEN